VQVLNYKVGVLLYGAGLGTAVNLWLSEFKVNDLTQKHALCTPKKIHKENLYAKFSD
jgi:hypothetical protein